MSVTPIGRFADPAGRYRLDARIATGGMGEVWRATDLVLDREVAVKVLKAEYADDATFRSRFETEARHAGSLHHRGVAAVFDFGDGRSYDGGPPRPFLVMELVDGRPLSELLRPSSPMDPGAARDLMAQAADAIAVAHAAGIVHRDVKPANLLVTPDRQVKITDFGIARAADGLALTLTGQVMGTPAYISPEQARGEPATEASDIYALGVVLYEALAGRRPFVGQTPITTALAHVREPVPDLPSSVPADLVAVTMRALAKDPAERFASAAEFAAALRDPAAAAVRSPRVVPVVAPPPVVPPPATRSSETRVLPAQPTGPVPPVPAAAPLADPGADPRPVPRGGVPAWVWVVVAVALIVAIAALLAVLARSGGSPSDQSSTSVTPSVTTTTATGTPTAKTVTLDGSDYVGRDLDTVVSELRAVGLVVSRHEVTNPGDEKAGTVSGVDPTGTVEVGDRVQVAYWGEQPSPTPSSSSASAPVSPSISPSSSPSSSPSVSPSGGGSPGGSASGSPSASPQTTNRNGSSS